MEKVRPGTGREAGLGHVQERLPADCPPTSALVYPKDIERFATDAGLGAAQLRNRIPALAERVLEEIPAIDKSHRVAEEVAALIEERCKDFRDRFSKK